MWSSDSVGFAFPRPLRLLYRLRRNRPALATALAPLGDPIRINSRGHSSRVGLGFLGNDDAFPLRDFLGIQHLCRAYGFSAPSCFTLGFLGCVFFEKRAAYRYRRFVAVRGFDALLPGEAVGKALHRRRGWIRGGAVAARSAKEGKPASGGAVLQLADDAPGDIAHGVDRTDHLLLADND